MKTGANMVTGLNTETFFDSPECKSGTHCRVCRNKTAGTRFRQSVAAYFNLPTDEWDCPHGHPWGLDSMAVAVRPSETQNNTSKASNNSKTKDREKIIFDFRHKLCRECDEFTGNHCDRKFPDGCCVETWHKFLHGHTDPCPLGKWIVHQASDVNHGVPHVSHWAPPANAAETCATCEVNGSCPAYCRTCGGSMGIIAPCPVGRW